MANKNPSMESTNGNNKTEFKAWMATSNNVPRTKSIWAHLERSQSNEDQETTLLASQLNKFKKKIRAESFNTSLIAGLRQDINWVSSYIRCINRKNAWRNYFVKTLLHEDNNKYKPFLMSKTYIKQCLLQANVQLLGTS